VNLLVKRFNFTDISTEGQMSIDGEAFAWTLELPVRDGLPGSAIPVGTYKVVAYPSPHFGRLMPLLVDVPGRSEIEIHWGNTAADTRGCILLGDSVPGANFIGDSRQAFDNFWARAHGPIERGECSITIESEVRAWAIKKRLSSTYQNGMRS
jgi:hypothetical protein